MSTIDPMRGFHVGSMIAAAFIRRATAQRGGHDQQSRDQGQKGQKSAGPSFKVTERHHVSVVTGRWRVVGDVTPPTNKKKCDVLVFGHLNLSGR